MSKLDSHDQVDANLVKRLRRVSGHLDSVMKMVDDGRSCTEVLQQLSAVIAALNGSRLLLLKSHVNKCIKPALAAKDEGLVEELEIVLQQAIKG